nr:hypothetical protein [Tanacetum cinerariifolium]
HHSVPQLGLHGGYRLIGDAAGHDVAKIAEVGIYVESQAVERDPAAAPHPHCADFAGIGGAFFPVEPHAGKARDAAGPQPVFGQGLDDGFLQRPQALLQLPGRQVGHQPKALHAQLVGAGRSQSREHGAHGRAGGYHAGRINFHSVGVVRVEKEQRQLLPQRYFAP